jgi:hypothetical protein
MRPLSPHRPIYLAAVIAALFTGCNDASNIAGPTRPAPTLARDVVAGAATVMHVADVEQLYAAVNDPANTGSTILLAPGTYVLSATDAGGVVRPNGGRVELQQDMSMSGVAGDRAAVVIDAASLPASSFPTTFGRTGVIRIGRGTNAVEWLTVAGNPLAAAAIETDLGSTAAARVRVAHVVAGNSARGVDVRNVGAAMAGRRLHAEITDNDFFRGVEGIRVANFVGAHGGHVTVVMSGNRSYENVLGCILENNRSNFASIHVRSSGDRFYDNGFGCQVGAALASSGVLVGSSAELDAHGTAFIDNTRTEFFNNTGQDFGADFAGLLVVGGDVLGSTATTSHNTVVVRLWGSRVSGNQRADLEAWGARSQNRSRVAGIDNKATIELHGVSRQIDVAGGNSSPTDPTGTNTLTIIR